MDELRLLNVLLCGLTSLLLWVHFNDRPSSTPRAGRVLRHAIVAAFAVGAVGALELYLKGAPIGVATVALAFVCSTILGALWRLHRH